MMPSEETPQQPVAQPSLPPQRRPFIALAVDAIENEYLTYQDGTRPIKECIKAGHRLLGTAARLLVKDDVKLSTKLVAFLKSYSPPIISASLSTTVDELPVRRIDTGGAMRPSDFPLSDNLESSKQTIMDQWYERYYSTVLVPVVGFVIVKLAEMGYVRLHPRPFTISDSLDEEEIDSDEISDDEEAED